MILLLKDGSVELTDLFLDFWVSFNSRCRVLNERELEDALKRAGLRSNCVKRQNGNWKNLSLCRTGKIPSETCQTAVEGEGSSRRCAERTLV